TAAAGGLAALSMAGIPGLLGFAAKELGYKAGLDAPAAAVLVVVAMVAAGAVFVAVAAASGYGPFAGRPGDVAAHAHEAPPALWLGPVVLGALGVVAGLLPALGAAALISSAASAIAGVPVAAKVQPWYGIDAALGLSALTLALGAGLYLTRRPARSLVRRLDVGARFGPERVYFWLEAAMKVFAGWLTATLQHGKLRLYLLVVFAVAIAMAGLAWAVLVGRTGVPDLGPAMDLRGYEVAVAAVILGGAAVAVRSNSRLAAVAALGVVGYGIALVYLLFGAPDLAMTQVLVETLTVILFILVFYHLPRFATFSGRLARARDAAIALAAGALMTVFVLAVTAVPHDPISTFFLEASVPEGRGRNVVNVIIVDFRALDTLGEITVLGLAGIGVFALLKLRPRRRVDKGAGE
ncbi:MAG: DUF4040 domain-containing protein, partial [Chloroflexi bacterium]|nr:DUF4040 domain-containing protein [Chloroflexota bacterium]